MTVHGLPEIHSLTTFSIFGAFRLPPPSSPGYSTLFLSKVCYVCLSDKVHVIHIHVSRSHPGGEETIHTKVLAFCSVLAHKWGEKYPEKRHARFSNPSLHSD